MANIQSVATKLITLTTSASTTPTIDMQGAIGATLYPTAAISTATYTPHTSPTYLETSGDVYMPVWEQAYDEAADAYKQEPVVITVGAGKCMKIPDACFPCAGLRLVGDAAGTVRLHIHYLS